MSNESGFRARGARLVLKMREIEETTAGGILLAGSAQSDLQIGETCGQVVEIGPSCWPDEAPWCALGDWVFVERYTGVYAKGKDGKQYRIVRDEHIAAVLDEGFFPSRLSA